MPSQMCSACCDLQGRRGDFCFFWCCGLSKKALKVEETPWPASLRLVGPLLVMLPLSRCSEGLRRVLSSGLHYTIANPKLHVSLHRACEARLYEEILLLFGFLWFCLIITEDAVT